MTPPFLRRWIASLHFVIVLGLLAVLFIFVNWIASRRYVRVDLSSAKISTLSDQTRRVLAGLTEPVSVIVFYQPRTAANKPVILYPMITDLLKEYRAQTGRLTVELIDPQQDIARAKQLVDQFKIDDLNLVIFSSGGRHKQLNDTDLAEYDFSAMAQGGEPRVKTFKGEDAFTSAILSVTRAEAPLVWMTGGHGEKSIAAEPQGLSDLKETLSRQNITLETVTLLERDAIPETVRLIILPGPTRRFADRELELLQGYLERGGRLLALLDPLTDTGLEPLLARWGIAMGQDIVVDPERQLPFVSAGNLLVTDYTQHPIVHKMKTFMTLFPLARSVTPVQPPPPGVTVTPLAVTSAKGWGETTTSVQEFKFDEGADRKGPVSIAAAAERAPASPEAALVRLVVVGDSEFVVNAQLGNIGNRDFLLGAIYWLIQQEQLIGIGPKTLESLKLNLTSAQLTGAFWLCFAGLPLLFGLLGVAVWWRRRR